MNYHCVHMFVIFMTLRTRIFFILLVQSLFGSGVHFVILSIFQTKWIWGFYATS